MDLFDPAAPIVVNFPNRAPITLSRFPSDEDWLARVRGMTIHTNQRGTRTFTRDPKVDAAIILPLIVQGGPPSPADCGLVLDLLGFVAETAVKEDPETNSYSVSMNVLGIPTQHHLKAPTPGNLAAYRLNLCEVRTATKNKRGMVSHVEAGPACSLFDSLQIESIGYAGEVSTIHKLKVIEHLLGAIGD